jgi:amino acid permease
MVSMSKGRLKKIPIAATSLVAIVLSIMLLRMLKSPALHILAYMEMIKISILIVSVIYLTVSAVKRDNLDNNSSRIDWTLPTAICSITLVSFFGTLLSMALVNDLSRLK